MKVPELANIRRAYFLGIGGIGMSAIARYLHSSGVQVCGYDRTATPLTRELESLGMQVWYDDDPALIPEEFHTASDESLLVLTPAIPASQRGWQFLKDAGVPIFKRSEVLGIISRGSYTIAVAGTHGKTTTSTMIAHLLRECQVNFSAFLGGISSNYQTNYVHFRDGKDLFSGKPVVVLEADEFDRSFHRLSPDVAVITAVDPDHLDIYHTESEFREAFDVFASKIRSGGHLFYKSGLQIRHPEGVSCLSYGTSGNEDVSGNSIRITGGFFAFDFKGGKTNAENLKCGLPGKHNVENITAAIAVCNGVLNLPMEDIRRGVLSFLGVKRRFEYIVRSDRHIVIDDYAHHPTELEAIIGSVRMLYPDKKITGIFQPHLFSRTRDFAEGFAQSLAMLDELVLMDIYPAREEPIPGITSAWLLDQVYITAKSLLPAEEILAKLDTQKPEVLLILGAGDIDKIVEPIRKLYGNVD